jgi:hypothetical protein
MRAPPVVDTTRLRLSPDGRSTSTRGSVKFTAWVPVAVTSVLDKTEQLPPYSEIVRLIVRGALPEATTCRSPGSVP